MICPDQSISIRFFIDTGTCGALVDEHGNVAGVVSAKLDASAALAASGVPQGEMNYAVKSREERHVAVPNFRDADTASLPFPESVPDVANRLKEPVTTDRKFEDVVKSAQHAAVLVLVY